MNNKKLERWAQQLLDTGKSNNMINFRTTKASTAEVVYPDVLEKKPSTCIIPAKAGATILLTP